MKRKSAWLSFAACALMAAQPVKAASEKTDAPQWPKALEVSDFSKVQVLALNGNAEVGFFDRGTGTLYVYDSSLTRCISIKKLKTLGESAETITH